jgi:hypothetical protein
MNERDRLGFVEKDPSVESGKRRERLNWSGGWLVLARCGREWMD